MGRLVVTATTTAMTLVWLLSVCAAPVPDRAQNPAELLGKMRTSSAGLLPFMAIAITFAAFDWLMSLNPHWYSTIFGVYFFAGSFLSALSILAIGPTGCDTAAAPASIARASPAAAHTSDVFMIRIPPRARARHPWSAARRRVGRTRG